MRIDLEHFPQNETAKKMIGRVSPVYEKSYVGKWIFEVLGAEMEEAGQLLEELRLQAFPELSTWGIQYWEERYGIEPDERLDLETRRKNVKAQRDTRYPMNPVRVENILSTITGRQVTITENTAPYTFTVTISDSTNIIDYAGIHARLRKIKPSHQRYLLVISADTITFTNPNKLILASILYSTKFANQKKELRLKAFETAASFLHSYSGSRLKQVGFTSILRNSNFVSIDGMKFNAVFHNFGQPIRLDGARRLDGSWSLGQRISKGLPMESFQAAYGFKNNNFMNSWVYELFKISYKSKFSVPEINIASSVKEMHSLNHNKIKVSAGVRTQNRFGAGTLTRDTMYRLDGSTLLDGSRKLNAAEEVKEEI